MRTSTGIGSIASTPATVIATTVRAYAQKSDAGVRTAAVQLKSGATVAASPTLTLSTPGWGWAWRTDLTDPNTGAAWTPAAVNNAQIGPKSGGVNGQHRLEPVRSFRRHPFRLQPHPATSNSSTGSSNMNWVRAADFQQTGKFYWEITMTTWAGANTAACLATKACVPATWNAAGLLAIYNDGDIRIAGNVIVSGFTGLSQRSRAYKLRVRPSPMGRSGPEWGQQAIGTASSTGQSGDRRGRRLACDYGRWRCVRRLSGGHVYGGVGQRDSQFRAEAPWRAWFRQGLLPVSLPALRFPPARFAGKPLSSNKLRPRHNRLAGYRHSGRAGAMGSGSKTGGRTGGQPRWRFSVRCARLWKGQYSRIIFSVPIFAADLTIAPVANFSGDLTPTIVLAADLDVHVNLTDFAGGLVPQDCVGRLTEPRSAP